MLVSMLILAAQASPIEAATTFLESLAPSSRRAAMLPFEDGRRTLFQFVPMERRGALVGDFSQGARAKADALLGIHLSKRGMKQIETIRSLEDVLFAIDKNPTRDKTAYVFNFFGAPSKSGVWAWRYEGHHLSLNYTYKDGAMVSSSPQFLGAAPAEVRNGPMKGTRALADEEDFAFALLNSLTAVQKRKAVISIRVPREIDNDVSGLETRNDRVAQIEGKLGLSFAALDAKQKAMLKKLVRAHADVQSEAEVNRRLHKIEHEGWDNVVFAWMGSAEGGKPHYYRIQGPTFLVELDNSQDGANHIHSVWRDFKNDYGRDVLAEHYAHSPHHHRR
jgi:hypothetical protein